jgi:ABC-2 type transport system permease protein
MKHVLTVFKRELAAYFNNPLAYVLILIFNVLSIVFLLLLSDFFQVENATLDDFFGRHVWLLLIVGPAIGMRLWSEEQRAGTIELILTMPVTAFNVILGKFLAALVVLLAALVSTMTVVWTVGYLGNPDYGTIFSGYLSSLLTGGACIAVTCFVSALTRSQVTCLLVSITILFLMTIIGFPPCIEFLRDTLGESISGLAGSMSLYQHSAEINAGKISLQSLIFFVSIIGFGLYLTSAIIRSKRS